jgi:hypothetical protein
MPRLRLSLPAALVLAATAVALASVLHSGPHMWRTLDREHERYAAYSETERRHAALRQLGLPGEVFDYYARYVGRGDRVYYQVQVSGLGPFLDLPKAVAYAGRFYLLPAVQARNLDDASVVVTFHEDPSRLGVPFITQQQAGLQPLYVSRISAP